MKRFKYSVNTNSLKNKMQPEDIVSFAVECKLDGIEWGIRSIDNAIHEMKEMAQRTQDAGLEVVNWLIGGKPWKEDDLKRRVELVAGVGGKSMRINHPWIAWDFEESLHQEKSFNEILKQTMDSLPFLTKLSNESGVRFLFETHSGALFASALAAKIFCEGANPEHVGIIYDPANTILEGNLRPRSEVEILGKYLAYVHAKNIAFSFDKIISQETVKRASWTHRITTPENGMVDWLEVFFALKNGNFSGFISSEEYFSADNLDVAKAGIAFLKDCEKYAPSAICEPFTKFNE